MSRLERAAARSRNQQQVQQAAEDAEPEWWEKGLGVALGNPVTKALLYPLDKLDMARRAMVYGAGEAAKALPEKWESMLSERIPAAKLLQFIDEDRANQGFKEAVTSPDYGYGDIALQIPEGSPYAKWGNRFTGLVGDVALDPTTYITGGYGAGTRFAGKAGRANLARRFTRMGPEFEEVAQRAGKYGTSALTPDELAKIGVLGRGYGDLAPDINRVASDLGNAAPRTGVRFAGAHIPGTENLSRYATRGAAGARLGLNRIPGSPRVPIARKLDRWRSPQGLEDAYTKLTTGRGTMSATAAAELVDSDNARRMASKTFAGTFVQQQRQAVRGLRGEDAQNATRAAEQGGTVWNEIAENAAEMAEDMGVEVYRSTGVGRGTKAWIPHNPTPDARRWWRSDGELAADLNDQFGIDIMDMEQESGVLLRRTFKARDEPYIVKGRKVYIDSDTVDGINAAFALAFPENKFKMLDDNMTSIMASYISGLSRDVGGIARAQRLLSSKSGMAAYADEARVLRQVPDSKKVNQKANKMAFAENKALLQRMEGRAAALRAEAAAGTGRARQLITEPVRDALEELPMASAVRARVKKLMASELTVEANRGELIRTFNQEIAEYTKRLDEAAVELDKVERDALDAIEIGETLKDTEKGRLARARAKERRRLAREIRANAEVLEHERETARAILERIDDAEVTARKAEILQENIPSESFIASYGGRNVPLGNPPAPMVETLERDRELVKRYETFTKNIEEARAESDKYWAEYQAIDDLSTREGNLSPELAARRAWLHGQITSKEGLANNLERGRARIAETYGFTEPEYSIGGRTFNEEELEAYVDAPIDAEKASLERMIATPPPKAPPPPPGQAEIAAAQKEMEQARVAAQRATVPPSGVSLPTLRKRVRVAKNTIAKFEAEQAAMEAPAATRRTVSELQYQNALREVEQAEKMVRVSADRIADLRSERDRLQAMVERSPRARKDTRERLRRITAELKQIEERPSRVRKARRTIAKFRKEAAAANAPRRGTITGLQYQTAQADLARYQREIANIVEGVAPDPATYTRELREAERELRAAQKAFDAAPRGAMKNNARRRVAKAQAQVDQIAARGAPDAKAAAARLSAAEAKLNTLLETKARTGAHPAALRRHAEEVERAKQRLKMIPEERRIAHRRAKQKISGYRYPQQAPLPAEVRASLLKQQTDLMKRATELKAGGKAHKRVQKELARIRQTLEGKLPSRRPLDVERQQLRRIIDLASMTNLGMDQEEDLANLRQVLKFSDDLEPPQIAEMAQARLRQIETEKMARTREPLMTPTAIREQRAELTPMWSPPVPENDPIKLAINTAQSTTTGSPTIKARARAVASDHEQAVAVAQRLVDKGDPIVDVTWRDRMVTDAIEMEKAADNYKSFPATDTRKRLEELQTSLRRDVEFTLRYAKAVKAGAPPGDDLATHVMRSIVDAEHEAVRADRYQVVVENKQVLDPEVDQMVDMFTNLIENVANATNAETQARNLMNIEQMAPDERIAYLRGRIEFEEAWQASSKERLRGAKRRARYRRNRPLAVGRPQATPLQMQRTDPHEDVLRQYNRETRAVRDYTAGRRKSKPVRTVTRAQANEARQSIADIEAARKLNLERKAARATQQSDVRMALLNGEMTFTEFLESEIPEARVMDVIHALTALPDMSTVKARRLMTEAGIPLGKEGKARTVRVGNVTIDRSPAEYRDMVQRFERERRAARAFKAGRGNKPPPPTVTSRQAANARAALKAIETGEMTELQRREMIVGPSTWQVDQPIETTTKKKVQTRLVPTKMSQVGSDQRRKLAELVQADRKKLGLDVETRLPEAYQFSPQHYARTRGLQRNTPALNAANLVTEIEREIAGQEEALVMLRQQLRTAEEHGLTGDMLAVKNMLERKTGAIEGDDLELMKRVFDPDTAEFLRIIYQEMFEGDRQQANDMLEGFLRRAFGDDKEAIGKMARDLENEFGGRTIYNTETHRFEEVAPPDWMAGADPEVVGEGGELALSHQAERMKRAISYAALHNARAKSSDQIQILIDTFKTFNIKRGEDLGIMETLGYNRSRGTLNEERLREVITNKIHGNEGTYTNVRDRRIAELDRKLAKLDGTSRALGKRETKTTIPKLKEIKGLRGAPRAQATRRNAVTRMHISAIKKMMGPTPKVRLGGRALPRADWRRAAGIRVGLRPGEVRPRGVGGYSDLFRESPVAAAKVLAGEEAEYLGARTAATRRLAELQTELANIASAESELPAAQAAVWARKAEAQQLQEQLEQASGPVTKEISEWQSRILSNLDDDRRYHETALNQFDDYQQAQMREPSLEARLRGEHTYHQQLAAIDDMMVKTREAIIFAKDRQTLLESRRAALQADMKILRRDHPSNVMELNRYTDDLSAVAMARLEGAETERLWQVGPIKAPEGGIGPSLAALPEEVDPLVLAETLLQDANDKFGAIFMHDLGIKQVERMKQAAKKGKLVKVTKSVLDDGWAQIAKNMKKDGGPGVVVAQELRNAMINIDKQIENGEIARTIAFFTDFFKTYAVMSPGFQIRNAISAAFMNATEGVGLIRAQQAAKIWKEYRKDSEAFAIKHNLGGRDRTRGMTQVGEAMTATLGSGAGGQFAERGVGATRSNVVFNNPLTQLSKWSGEWVEGPVRLALALDSIARGDDMFDALTRVTRLHFDYSQVSRFDERAKLLVPFWTFMSRNIPLQISQMWLKPNVYLKYQSFVRNVSEEPDPLTPEYWLEQGAFTAGGTMPGTEDSLYWAPDLAHTRIQQDLATLSDPARMLSNVNPLIRVPVETLVTDRKLYTGQPFTDTPEEMDWKMLPFTPALWAMGSLQKNPEGGLPLVGERGAYAARSLFPPLQVASRLFPNENDEFNKDKQQQSMLRWLGLPVYQLNDTARAAEQRRQQFAARP